MLKKIIFDLDDTLIMNDKSQIQDYQIVLDKYDHHNISANELYKCIGDYEINTTCYQKDTLLAFINKYFNQNYPIEFIDGYYSQLIIDLFIRDSLKIST